jgi:hypothetical protein
LCSASNASSHRSRSTSRNHTELSGSPPRLARPRLCAELGESPLSRPPVPFLRYHPLTRRFSTLVRGVWGSGFSTPKPHRPTCRPKRHPIRSYYHSASLAMSTTYHDHHRSFESPGLPARAALNSGSGPQKPHRPCEVWRRSPHRPCLQHPLTSCSPRWVCAALMQEFGRNQRRADRSYRLPPAEYPWNYPKPGISRATGRVPAFPEPSHSAPSTTLGSHGDEIASIRSARYCFLCGKG